MIMNIASLICLFFILNSVLNSVLNSFAISIPIDLSDSLSINQLQSDNDGVEDVEGKDYLKIKGIKSNEHESFIFKPNPMEAGLFEGDIDIDYEKVKIFYGDDVANIHKKAGTLRSENKNRNNINDNDNNKIHRDLGLMVTYDLLWKTRNNDGKIVIPYYISPKFTNEFKQIILNGLNDLATQTGVVIFKQYNNEPDYILFDNSASGCYSKLGRVEGGQIINLGIGCNFTTTVQHEVLHAMGFWHEQSRQDRDEYVDILWNNIEAGKEYNFNKELTESLGSKYDYKSIMHYLPISFGKYKPTCKKSIEYCNSAFAFIFRGSGQDGTKEYCLTIDFNNGDGDDDIISDGTNIILYECGLTNQLWIIEPIGETDSILRSAINPDYCLTADYDNEKYIVEGSSLKIYECRYDDIYPYEYQRFQLHFSTPNSIIIRWEGNILYGISRNTTISNKSSNYMTTKISYVNTDNRPNQYFKLARFNYTTNQCDSINGWCLGSNNRSITIDAHSYENIIGKSEFLSKDDILQVKLLYKCLDGPRNINEFCTDDCLCEEGEGNCIDDSGCKSGLVCEYDDISMNRCVVLTGTRKPTYSPTKRPTYKPSKSPIKITTPTKRPIKSKTIAPTKRPPTRPTKRPTRNPTYKPTKKPSTKKINN